MTNLGLAGYPAMRIVALAETGTRRLPGAVIGGRGERSEVPPARKLVPLVREGMLLLADRAYDAATPSCSASYPASSRKATLVIPVPFGSPARSLALTASRSIRSAGPSVGGVVLVLPLATALGAPDLPFLGRLPSHALPKPFADR